MWLLLSRGAIALSPEELTEWGSAPATLLRMGELSRPPAGLVVPEWASTGVLWEQVGGACLEVPVPSRPWVVVEVTEEAVGYRQAVELVLAPDRPKSARCTARSLRLLERTPNARPSSVKEGERWCVVMHGLDISPRWPTSEHMTRLSVLGADAIKNQPVDCIEPCPPTDIIDAAAAQAIAAVKADSIVWSAQPVRWQRRSEAACQAASLGVELR